MAFHFHKPVTKPVTESRPNWVTISAPLDPKPPRLTTAYIKTIDRAGRWGDGRGSNGLSIIAYDNAAGGLNLSWSQRILVEGKQTTFGLGRWPQISLATARKRAFENVRNRDNGESLRGTKRNIPTLGEAFDQHIADHSTEWQQRGEKRAKKLKNTWELSKQHCEAKLSKKITHVTHEDVIDIFRDKWHQIPRAAAEVQNHLSQIFVQAVEMGIRSNNPATKKFIVRTLGKQPKRINHPAAPYEDLGGYLAIIRDADFWWAEKYCLIMLALTEDRSGELREAVWDDIDWEEETLTIPADRMKGDEEHIIPLCTQALEIVRFAWSQPHHSQGTIFPPQRGGLFIDSSRLAKIPKKLGLPFVPHGLRSSFANWAFEHPNPEYKELAKISLAHQVDNASDKPYFRTPVVDKRRVMLQEYADFLAKTCGPFIAQKDREADTAEMTDTAGLERALGQLFTSNKTA